MLRAPTGSSLDPSHSAATWATAAFRSPAEPAFLADLDTPALVLDRTVLDRNVADMKVQARRLGVQLRPHMKTAKSSAIALRAFASEPIAVSTLAEARYFADAGFRDILIPNLIDVRKLARLAELQASGVAVTLTVADVGGAMAICGAAERLEADFPVMIEIESGGKRTGIDPGADELIAIARTLDDGRRTSIAGVLTYAGQSYGCSGAAALRDVATVERDATVGAAQRIRSAGLPCPVVSVGSTPTAVHADDMTGVSEIRPGNFVFFDLMQVQLGCCAIERIAVSVLATVLSVDSAAGLAVVDAGTLALSKDGGVMPGSGAPGYGLVLTAGSPQTAPLQVTKLNQEHGLIEAEPASLGGLRPGQRVRILPYHSCMTAAAYDRYYVTDGGDEIVGVWSRIGGWA